MENIPRYDDGRCRLDAFCKSVLRNEAVDYIRKMKRQVEHEKSFSDLSIAEKNQLCTEDSYSFDEFVFSSHGCELHINNEKVGDSLAMDKVVRHYEHYINKLCTRKLYDEYGRAHYCLDEYMKRHLEIKLITAILNSMEFE